jgi:hypothetical protein
MKKPRLAVALPGATVEVEAILLMFHYSSSRGFSQTQPLERVT